MRIAITSTLNSLPYSIVKSDFKTGKQIPGGIETRIMQIMAKKLNFTIEWVITPNKSGNLLANKTWNGMVGMIVRQEVEIATGGISLTPERMTAADFLFPHEIDQNTFALSASSNEGNNNDSINLLIRPFQLQVWFVFLVTFLLFGILHHMFIKPLLGKHLNNLNREFNDKETCLKPKIDHNLVWINFCLLLRQSYHWLSNSRSCHILSSIKICSIIWALSSLVISNFYTGYLCSMLTLPSTNQIDSIEKFAHACENGQLIPLGLKNTNVMNIISKSNMQSLKTIWRHIKLIKNRETGMNMISAQLELPISERIHYAIISPRERLRFLQMNDNIIHLPPKNSDSSIYSFFVAIPVRKSFRHRKHFDQMSVK
ncbi:Ligand-gated ion channel-like protein [Euroglyphus maynei]|uniref:Ligand-gated ion channel-like protein n=1 Tax=Euroglyphus maynei TaxID=6958 RepID=A0A1Y3AL50_EURMA|nr:Ligand-gated ion channel-like protein [Euroglyphus maynei]